MQLVDPDKTLARLSLSQFEIQAFCQRWQVSEFALFGSVLREDFRPDSDVDVLVTFFPTVHWGLTETIQMQDEQKASLDEKLTLLSNLPSNVVKTGLENNTSSNPRRCFIMSKATRFDLTRAEIIEKYEQKFIKMLPSYL